MHSQSNPDQSPDALVLEQLPNGEHAWLRPERDRRFMLPSRYWLTDKVRAAIPATVTREGRTLYATASDQPSRGPS
jgi:hypothetical protein